MWWRITIYDQQGGVVGYRELTQTSDCKYPNATASSSSTTAASTVGSVRPCSLNGRAGPRLGQTDAAAQELLL